MAFLFRADLVILLIIKDLSGSCSASWLAYCQAYQRKKYFYYDPPSKYSKIAPEKVESCLWIYQKTRLKGFGRGRKA
jgi:hypothetical protein